MPIVRLERLIVKGAMVVIFYVMMKDDVCVPFNSQSAHVIIQALKNAKIIPGKRCALGNKK